jgi:hypothetical protein
MQNGIGYIDDMMIAFGILLTLLYLPFIYASATSPRWAFLAISLVCLIAVSYRKVNFTLLHLFGLLFICWSTLSLIWTSNIYDGIDALIKFVILGLAFVVGSYLHSLKQLFVGLAIGITVSSILVLFGFSGGLFVNFNILAETALIVAVGLWIYKKYLYLIGILPSIIFSFSRAALLVGSIFFTCWLWKRSKLYSICLIVGIVIISVGLFNYGELFGTARLRFRLETIDERFILWFDTIKGLNLLGNGLGSYFTSYPALTNSIDTLLFRPKFAHNDLLQIVFELGLIGGLLALLICWKVFSSKQNEKYVFAAFVGISIFSFPLYLPVTAFIAAIVCGYIAARSVDIQLSFINGRILLCNWYEAWQRRGTKKGCKLLSA